MAQWFRRTDTTLPPVLDEDYLDRLANHIGRSEVRELLADGLLELTDRIDLITDHASRGESDAIAEICHDIAGMAGHLGLTRLSHAAVDACRLCRTDPPAPPEQIVATISEARADAMAAASRHCQPVADAPAEAED